MLLQPAHGAAGPPLLRDCVHPCPQRISSLLGGQGNNFNHKAELTNPFVDVFMMIIIILYCARV